MYGNLKLMLMKVLSVRVAKGVVHTATIFLGQRSTSFYRSSLKMCAFTCIHFFRLEDFARELVAWGQEKLRASKPTIFDEAFPFLETRQLQASCSRGAEQSICDDSSNDDVDDSGHNSPSSKTTETSFRDDDTQGNFGTPVKERSRGREALKGAKLFPEKHRQRSLVAATSTAPAAPLPAQEGGGGCSDDYEVVEYLHGWGRKGWFGRPGSVRTSTAGGEKIAWAGGCSGTQSGTVRKGKMRTPAGVLDMYEEVFVKKVGTVQNRLL